MLPRGVFRLEGDPSREDRQRRRPHAAREELRKCAKDLEAVIQSRQRSGRKEGRDDPLNDDDRLPAQRGNKLRGTGATKVLERLAAPHQGQGITHSERNQNLHSQDRNLEKIAREIAQNDAVRAIPLESEKDEEHHRGVADKPCRRSQGKAALAEQERPERFSDSRGNDHEEKPLAELGREVDLRPGQPRSDPADQPWGRSRARRGEPAEPQKDHIDCVAEASPELFIGVPGFKSREKRHQRKLARSGEQVANDVGHRKSNVKTIRALGKSELRRDAGLNKNPRQTSQEGKRSHHNRAPHEMSVRRHGVRSVPWESSRIENRNGGAREETAGDEPWIEDCQDGASCFSSSAVAPDQAPIASTPCPCLSPRRARLSKSFPLIDSAFADEFKLFHEKGSCRNKEKHHQNRRSAEVKFK